MEERIRKIMNNLIVNANAPVVEIKLKVDFRFSPEQITLDIPSTVPAIIALKMMMAAASGIVDAIMQTEATAMKGKAPIPDLPPAPKTN